MDVRELEKESIHVLMELYGCLCPVTHIREDSLGKGAFHQYVCDTDLFNQDASVAYHAIVCFFKYMVPSRKRQQCCFMGCKYRSDRKAEFIDHINREHLGFEFTCTFCPHLFTKMDSWMQHLRRSHPDRTVLNSEFRHSLRFSSERMISPTHGYNGTRITVRRCDVFSRLVFQSTVHRDLVLTLPCTQDTRNGCVFDLEYRGTGLAHLFRVTLHHSDGCQEFLGLFLWLNNVK